MALRGTGKSEQLPAVYDVWGAFARKEIEPLYLYEMRDRKSVV